jgi:hypothetical protein
MNYPEMLSEHFSFKEATSSAKAESLGIVNDNPTQDIIDNCLRTATKMEIVKAALNMAPIHVDSWIRCPALNLAVGSKDTSQHLKGEAVDFIAPTFGDPLAICRALINHTSILNFDQLILEHTWVHISFISPDSKPRNQVLSLLETGHYATGLTNKDGVPYA